jgi:alpha-glucan,water dikinase
MKKGSETTMAEEITLESGMKLLVEKRPLNGRREISLRIKDGKNCLLHWGLSPGLRSPWRMPPPQFLPDGSRAYGQNAVRTPFAFDGDEGRIVIGLDKDAGYQVIAFTLYYPETGRWDNNHGKNYHIRLEGSGGPSPSPSQALSEETRGREVAFEEVYELEGEGELATALVKEGGRCILILLADVPGPLVLHWGVAVDSRHEWLLPPASTRPDGTEVFDGKAVQTPFAPAGGLNRLRLEFDEKEAPLGVTFVLKSDRWIKDRGQNFYVPVKGVKELETALPPGLGSIAEEIIRAETGDHSWTLMHRFNLCHDLSWRVRSNVEGLALLFVWLRYSAIRQLDWQRRYNTKPRELSHALDRLTLRLADIHISEPASRGLVRLMMTTLGRGGEGQRVRDEILSIMHRHRIKEVSGHFMEEWHQKLHNNTTPDDIVICEAYLRFLESDGDLNTFYKTLEAEGVSRERLKSFERPIVTHPDFVPHLKEGLIHDFYGFLKVLKSVHSGTDLESASAAAWHALDDETSGVLSFILSRREDREAPVVELAGSVAAARRALKRLLSTDRDSGRVRDVLFLDLALEGFLRVIVEREIHSLTDRDRLAELTGAVLENLLFSYDDPETIECFRVWERLCGMPRFTHDWSLLANAVLERLGRAIRASVDRHYGMLQPRAEFLGGAFRADKWTITLFTEELVRGGITFVLSMLLRHLNPMLRKYARLGDWQVISPGRARGRVEAVGDFGSIQGKRFDSPTVVIADKVAGDEEPPEGVTAVITPDAVDLVSHIAVRARNAHLLFATCYDSECMGRLKSLKGHFVDLNVNTSGDVLFEETAGLDEARLPRARPEYKGIARPGFAGYAVASNDFKEGLVGEKSNCLRRMEGRLPDWVSLPVSAALPFGAFEKVLGLGLNDKIAGRYRELTSRIEENPREVLGEIRKTLQDLKPPGELVTSLREVMGKAGIECPENFEDAWSCIKGVWASKWNERAYLSRKAWGIPHEELFMAVLVQEAVESEYAFVIHTVNPFTGSKDELYAEVVPGLGETLVGNFPGRAMSFTSSKEAPGPRLLMYPSKSTALYGGGLIFRSDSSGEDLAGYAGAGLYDSIMLAKPRESRLSYAEEPLIWDEGFRNRLLTAIAGIGVEVEEAFGSPQDIEGAYSKGRYYVVQSRPQVLS